MNRAEDYIKEQVSLMFGVAPSMLTLETRLKEDLDLDSIDLIDIISRANDDLKLELTPFDFDGCSTLGDFIDKVNDKLA